MSKNQKPRTYRYASKVSSTAADGVRGAALLLRVFKHSALSAARSAKDVGLNVKHGLKDGWTISGPVPEHEADRG